ncbi:MAG: hypothetical protein COB54_00460 [Alphaproteobacteria bacterium]|nr:MAG: hypothetical protein COB54_00460 [Alphaproteobacteria bacterium]
MAGKTPILMAGIIVLGVGAYWLTQKQEPAPQVIDLSPESAGEGADAGTGTIVSENTVGPFLDYDIVIGDKDAPVEIIEYAAISCSHCATFHSDVYPLLKEKYLDTGKARLVYRNFIFDNPFDVFAASLTRCVAEENFLPTLETYFDSQHQWNKLSDLKRIFEADGKAAAIKFAQGEVAGVGVTAGISAEDARACFNNKAVVSYLLKVRQEAVVKYDVQSTPTIIVGGKKLDRHDMAALERAIEGATKK